MAESVQELLDLYNRGWAPRASDELRDNFDDLLGRVRYFSNLLQDIYGDLTRHEGVGEPEQLRRLVYSMEKLDDLYARAQRNFDLERPYDFVDLQNFTKYIDSELQDIRYILQSGDWITDGIHQRFFELSDSFDDFVKSVYKEEIDNNDKRIALQNAAERDIKFNPNTNVKNKGDNTMDKTLEAFDGIYEYIKIFEQAVQDGEGYADAYSNIINFIDDLLERKEISERMAQKYFEIMNELHDYPSEMVKELKTLTNDYTDKAEDADKKLNVALDWSGNAAEYVDKQNDSKPTLDLLNNLISQYDKEYNELGELESVDALCRVGNEIRTALDENKLSRKTADDLMKPLQEIKDNIFDEKLHEDKIKEFMDVLADAMSRQDEKSPIEKPKGKDGAEIKSMGTNAGQSVVGNLVETAVNAQKTIAKTIDEKAKAKAAEHDKKQQREMSAKDIVQSAADDKRKLESELQQQDKTADKQGQKKESPEQQKAQDTDSKFGVLSDKVKYSQQEQALDNLRDLLNNYSEIYHSVPESRLDAWDKFINAYNRYIHQYPESELRNAEFNRAAFNVTNRDESIKFMKQAIGHAQFSLANSDGVAKDKHVVAGVENREQQHTPQTNEKAIAELQRIGKMFDRQHSDESLKKMMLSLKESVKQGVIPREYFDTYKGIVDDYKQNRNADNSLLRLDNEINLQIAEMRNDGKNAKEYPQQKKNKEREMRAADVVQSAADDKRKLEPELQQQDKTADKQDLKMRESEKPHDKKYRGFGEWDGREPKNKDRTRVASELKDGMVNVLNIQREEKRAANETKEKDSLEQRRIMALRKFFKKEQDQ